jgi:hypothetical protein
MRLPSRATLGEGCRIGDYGIPERAAGRTGIFSGNRQK